MEHNAGAVKAKIEKPRKGGDCRWQSPTADRGDSRDPSPVWCKEPSPV